MSETKYPSTLKWTCDGHEIELFRNDDRSFSSYFRATEELQSAILSARIFDLVNAIAEERVLRENALAKVAQLESALSAATRERDEARAELERAKDATIERLKEKWDGPQRTVRMFGGIPIVEDPSMQPGTMRAAPAPQPVASGLPSIEELREKIYAVTSYDPLWDHVRALHAWLSQRLGASERPSVEEVAWEVMRAAYGSTGTGLPESFASVTGITRATYLAIAERMLALFPAAPRDAKREGEARS